MLELTEQTIRARDIRSLVWRGDELIDFASGGISYALDGSVRDGPVRYAYRFDAAAISPSGRYCLLHERLGTKGVLLDGCRPVTEVNRSYYHADAYEYPAAFAQRGDGSEVLFHCPQDYNRIEVLDAATGVALYSDYGAGGRDPDFFHSRLAVSPGGRWLTSAGWIWHPIDHLMIFATSDLLLSPAARGDRRDLDHPLCRERLQDTDLGMTEVDSVAFLDEDQLIVSLYMQRYEGNAFDRYAEKIEVWNLADRCVASSVRLADLSGPLMPIDRDWVMGFHGHPKLISLRTGTVARRWQHLTTSTRLGSVCANRPPEPILAIDHAKRRFALADGQAIVVGTLQRTGA